MSKPFVDSSIRDERKNVEINIGKACNTKCVFCLDGMPTKEQSAFMPFEEMKSELERWRALGHLSVGFLGGEPTIYPKIVESVAYAAKLGYTRITIATNALMLRRPAFVDKLVAAGLTRVTISMHGHTKALEDKLSDVPGAFEKKCRAIALLQAQRARGALQDGVSVNVVLNGWNYRRLPKMMRFFFEELGLDDMRVNFVRPEGHAEANTDLTPTLSEVVGVLMKGILLNAYHFKKVFTFGGFPMCVLPRELLNSRNMLRSTMGDVFRDMSTDCSIRSEGGDHGVAGVEGGRARFNWQDRKRFDLKYQLAPCRQCACADVCEGVWSAYVDIYGDTEIAALDWHEGELVRSRPLPSRPPSPRNSNSANSPVRPETLRRPASD